MDDAEFLRDFRRGLLTMLAAVDRLIRAEERKRSVAVRRPPNTGAGIGDIELREQVIE